MQDEILAWKPKDFARLRRLVSKWYVESGRDLPWRQTTAPYEIWVSEIMLQQTQVATVIPYYLRFLQSFPDVHSLAKASLDDVYRHWSGLGYYRRARQLHQAAKIIKSDHNGAFPTEYDSLVRLPGIGRYTAGAVLSFSYDQRLPIVEANTQRLYSRLLHLKLQTSSKQGQEHLWAFAEFALPKRTGSGRINQALMEIGSQVCLPKNPLCLLCPLKALCPTFASNSQATIPVPKRPKEYTELREAALVIRDSRGRILMRRCGPEERWAGLWDFPRFDVTQCNASAAESKKIAAQFQVKFGRSIIVGKNIHELRHAVTRYRITLKSYEAAVDSSIPGKWELGVETCWVNPSKPSHLALSSSGKRLWSWLQNSVH
ncbi:MAG TPA: A/G-specific adenine glycosylase [Pirellula sp.]|nr:A/G-specific adenine glycosylase [Pirellula sp.]